MKKEVESPSTKTKNYPLKKELPSPDHITGLEEQHARSIIASLLSRSNAAFFEKTIQAGDQISPQSSEKKEEDLGDVSESSEERQEIVGRDFYRRMSEESVYALAIHSPAVDYLRLWGFSPSEERNRDAYQINVEGNAIGYHHSWKEERIGALTEQHAQSILERMLKMKQFGDDPSCLTPDEKERYEQWEHFSCNKALRNLWKATSTMRYDQFLPLLMDDAREAA